MHSIRLRGGREALVARVLTKEGKIGFGFSLRLDAGEARRMAEWHADVRKERPRLKPVLGHFWETAWVSGTPIDWNAEPGFAALTWLPA